MSSKKLIIALALVVTGVGTFTITSFVENRKEAKLENANTSIEENINTSESNKDGAVKINDYIKVDEKEGYITSLKQGAADLETIELNYLNHQIEAGFTLEEMLNIKNIAENFAESMALYDCTKPNKYVDIAQGFVSNEVDNVFLRIPIFAEKGVKENTKRLDVTDVESTTMNFNRETNRLELDVDVSWNWIDNYDKVVSKGVTNYYMTIKKIDGEYKITEFFVG
ncbi:MAG: hypothetical protein ACRC68_01525 [Clostridium sp.]